MKMINDCWFTIEPYVYINISDGRALLYNTLDSVFIETNKPEIITLLKDVIQEENCGVILLKKDRFKQSEINEFVQELREKYMGDVIGVRLSNGKPVQILPYINYPNKRNKKYNFAFLENLLQILFEVNIYLDSTCDVEKLEAYLQSIPDNTAFKVIGDWKEVKNGNKFMDFLNRRSASKIIVCSYTHIPLLDPAYNNDFMYKISVCFPINKLQWENSLHLLQNQELPFGYLFDITSLTDWQEAECLISEYQIEKYQLNPVYTGDNIQFFEENIFLTKEDILSVKISMKELFSKRVINKNDFGKIHILPNGDIYANMKHPVLGNIHTHHISDVIQKEINLGLSWLRVRDQAPCDGCIYQDLCPSPSDYEIMINRQNLCHVKY